MERDIVERLNKVMDWIRDQTFSQNDDGEWRMPPDAEEHWDSVWDAREILERLPKTADGVPVVPGMNLYAPNVDFDFGVLAVVDDPDNPNLNCRDVRGVEFGMDAGECYSTREAAEAAREGE